MYYFQLIFLQALQNSNAIRWTLTRRETRLPIGTLIPKDMGMRYARSRIIVLQSIVWTIRNAIVLIQFYLYLYYWSGSSTWRMKNDNLKLLLFLFCLNLWKFQGYDRVAVVSDKIDKQKYTTYLAPHARLLVDFFFLCIRFSNIIVYIHI